jgi:Glycosyltransferases involved in cell wall biogenesis
MFCSTIIPTIGRQTLTRAVESVLQQKTDHPFEVIVVNDTGRPLAPVGWQQDGRVTLLTTNQVERCVARNAGAALANGRYLHFLDDDDYLLPGAIAAWAGLATAQPQCNWLLGATQIVDRANRPLLYLRHAMQGNVFMPAMAGEWFPLQASLIRAELFFAVGGFNPLAVGEEDIELGRWLSLRTDLARTTAVVAVVGMGTENSTTNQRQARQRSHQAREALLNQARAFPRMWQSATDYFWRGRLARVYFTSAVWNMRQRRWWTAVSRAVWGLGCLIKSGPALTQRAYWRALSAPYQSMTFAQGHREAASYLSG